MKLPFVNEGIFEPHKNSVERGESSLFIYYIYTFFHTCYFPKVIIFTLLKNIFYLFNQFVSYEISFKSYGYF